MLPPCAHNSLEIASPNPVPDGEPVPGKNFSNNLTILLFDTGPKSLTEKLTVPSTAEQVI